MTGEATKGRVLAKVCGFTNPDQLRAAAALGVDLAGILLWEGSERAVSNQQAQAMSDVARECGIGLVGVFVDEDAEQIRRCYQELGLTVAQLHGGESLELVTELVDSGLSIWKGIQMSPGFHPDQARNFWQAGAQAVLLDAWHPHLRGGTGQQVDWQVAAKLSAQGPLVLAGGLSAANVEQAVRMIQPFAVDASSSLETSDGHKDMTKVQDYVRAAHRGLQQSAARD
jgi:phosphoribosylanthranilate isomerase